MSNGLNPEHVKELEELIKLFPKDKPKVPIEKMEQKEAKAILEYIDYLEKSVEYYRGQTMSVPKAWVRDEAKYNERELQRALTKLIGSAAGLHSSHKKSRPE